MAVYRGKHPNRIKEIWSNYRNPNIPRGRYIRTNIGNVYRVLLINKLELGMDIYSFPEGCFELRRANLTDHLIAAAAK